jgi:hypothetical protein
MKALSIRMPWAALIVAGHKDIENRTWASRYRGPLLIHAALAPARRSLADICAQYSVAITPKLEALCELRGGVVGRVDLIDCVGSHSSSRFDGAIDERGRRNFGFVLSAARTLPFHSMPGRLGLFELVTPDVTPDDF